MNIGVSRPPFSGGDATRQALRAAAMIDFGRADLDWLNWRARARRRRGQPVLSVYQSASQAGFAALLAPSIPEIRGSGHSPGHSSDDAPNPSQTARLPALRRPLMLPIRRAGRIGGLDIATRQLATSHSPRPADLAAVLATATP